MIAGAKGLPKLIDNGKLIIDNEYRELGDRI
jgi:hypothetical protein